MTTGFATIRLVVAAVSTAALLAVALTTAGEAVAGACEVNGRIGFWGINNQVRVRNETRQDITVVFYRENVSEAQKKKTQTLKRGKQAQYNFGIGGGNGEVTGIARIEIDGAAVLQCEAWVDNTRADEQLSTSTSTYYNAGYCKRLDSAGSVCLSCYTDCNKTVKKRVSPPNSLNWQTTFIIKN